MSIYNDFYTYEIMTPRLVLQPFSEERDLQTYQMHLSDGEDCLHLFGAPYSEWSKDYAVWHKNGDFTYTVLLRGTDTIIGSVSLHLSCNTGEPAWYLSFWIFEEYRQQDYAKEAVGALLAGFLWGSLAPKKQSKVFANTGKGNEAAVRLLRSLGFCKTGMLLQCAVKGDNVYLLETESYALLSSLFLNRLEERLDV